MPESLEKRSHCNWTPLLAFSAIVAFSLLPIRVDSQPKPRPNATQAAKPKPQPARRFTLTDLDGKKRTLAEFKGRPVALYFFCGCEPCHKVADAWGQIQQSGALRPSAPKDAEPATLLVFQGDVEAAQAFMHQVALDPKQTVVLPDPAMSVSRPYKAIACPRVFVVDAAGLVRYTNNGKDDAPHKGSALVITSKTLAALRAPTAPKQGKTNG